MCGDKGMLPIALHICVSYGLFQWRCACSERDRCEGRAHEPAREGFILGEGTYGAAGKSDVGEPSSKRVVPILFIGDRLKCVDVTNYLTYGDVQVDIKPRADPCSLKGEKWPLRHAELSTMKKRTCGAFVIL